MSKQKLTGKLRQKTRRKQRDTKYEARAMAGWRQDDRHLKDLIPRLNRNEIDMLMGKRPVPMPDYPLPNADLLDDLQREKAGIPLAPLEAPPDYEYQCLLMPKVK